MINDRQKLGLLRAVELLAARQMKLTDYPGVSGVVDAHSLIIESTLKSPVYDISLLIEGLSNATEFALVAGINCSSVEEAYEQMLYIIRDVTSEEMP